AYVLLHDLPVTPTPGRYLSSAQLGSLDDAPAPTLYSLSLHDALPIFDAHDGAIQIEYALAFLQDGKNPYAERYDDAPFKYINLLDRKSTRLNSSHVKSSYAGFCLKKKNSTTRRAASAAPQQGVRMQDT